MNRVSIVFFALLLLLSCKKSKGVVTENPNKTKVSYNLSNSENSIAKALNKDFDISQGIKGFTFFINKDKYLPYKITKEFEDTKIDFNQKISIIDTIREVYFYDIKSYLIQCEKFEKPIWSGFFSSFKFPETSKKKELICSDKSYDPFDCLFEYFTNSLKWESGIDFLEHREYDEETFSFIKGFRLDKNQLSFWSAIQLTKQIYNLSDDFEENFYHNDNFDIWTGYDKSRSIFVRVIEENKVIQIVLDDYSYKNFEDYNKDAKTIKNIISKNKFSETNWENKITMNRTWDFILSIE